MRGRVRFRRALRTHLVKLDVDAAARELPGGLRAGEAAADYPHQSAHTELLKEKFAGASSQKVKVKELTNTESKILPFYLNFLLQLLAAVRPERLLF
jgi:hypothetical protein